jgi:ribosomal protein S18 acetylase RimI-like enzyme
MAIEIRKALTTDIDQLLRLRLIAHGGFNEALYENLELPVEAIIASELRDSASIEYYGNYWVAIDQGEIVGGLSAFPSASENPTIDHPLLPPERLALESPFASIEVPQSYFIHVIAVFAEFKRRGIGAKLLDLAKAQAIAGGFGMLSLYVFAQNSAAVALYQQQGFRETGRSPLVPHPKLVYSGDVLLMTCATGLETSAPD